VAQITGTVTSGLAPLAGVTVKVGSKTTTTSAAGTYRIQKLGTGMKTATFSKIGYQTVVLQVRIRATGNVLNVAMSANAPVTVVFNEMTWDSDLSVLLNGISWDGANPQVTIGEVAWA
jgi:hypothetical protein